MRGYICRYYCWLQKSLLHRNCTSHINFTHYTVFNIRRSIHCLCVPLTSHYAKKAILHHLCLTFLDPLPVENLLMSLVGNIVNITWSPSSIFNGMIVQYIVQGIDSSGKSYHSVSGDQHYMELPYFNDALVYVASVN